MTKEKFEQWASDGFIYKLKNGEIENTSKSKDEFYKNKITIEFHKPDPTFNLTIKEVKQLALDWFSDCGVPAQAENFLEKKLTEMNKKPAGK